MSLAEEFRSLAPPPQAGRPEFLRDDATAIRRLIRSGRVTAVHDTFLDQARELLETRHPRPSERAQVDRQVGEYLQDRDPDQCGVWAFFRWSGRLVHLLEEADYRELRTSRNRYKITATEQARLSALRLGIVGLSVGSASAVTLALEGIGGEYRLADFDSLSLSNMNRLRSGVHDVGMNKAVLTAREIFEIDPYANIRLYPQGLNDANIDDFLTGGGRLDLLIEECDDLFLKVRLREKARALRMAVLMETSDRGLIDVERFDLEPDRSLLHGLIGDTRADELRGLATADKVPFVLDILGIETLSDRFEASLYEVDRTLRTWPQLASAVALGGALNADTARRIALGQMTSSGRFYVDLERIVSPENAATIRPRAPEPEHGEPFPTPKLIRTGGAAPSVDEIRSLVQFAALAPSGGNSQPWRFEWRDSRLLCRVDPTRTGTLLDRGQRAAQLALGAAVENFVLAAAALNYRCELDHFPDPSDASSVCAIALTRSVDLRSTEETVEAIARRTTNRRLGLRSPLSRREQQLLRDALGESAATLRLVVDGDAQEELSVVLGEGDRLRLLNPRSHRDMMGEVRWTESEVRATRDGLDFRTLELSPTDLAALRLSASHPPLELLRGWNLGSALAEGARKSVHAASAIGLLTMPEPTATAWFEGGRALERVWLAATRLGLAFQPMTSLPYLASALGEDDEFLPPERDAVLDLRRRYRAAFGSGDAAEIMIFRIAYADAPRLRSLRRPVEEILQIPTGGK